MLSADNFFSEGCKVECINTSVLYHIGIYYIDLLTENVLIQSRKVCNADLAVVVIVTAEYGHFAAVDRLDSNISRSLEAYRLRGLAARGKLCTSYLPVVELSSLERLCRRGHIVVGVVLARPALLVESERIELYLTLGSVVLNRNIAELTRK